MTPASATRRAVGTVRGHLRATTRAPVAVRQFIPFRSFFERIADVSAVPRDAPDRPGPRSPGHSAGRLGVHSSRFLPAGPVRHRRAVGCVVLPTPRVPGDQIPAQELVCPATAWRPGVCIFGRPTGTAGDRPDVRVRSLSGAEAPRCSGPRSTCARGSPCCLPGLCPGLWRPAGLACRGRSVPAPHTSGRSWAGGRRAPR